MGQFFHVKSTLHISDITWQLDQFNGKIDIIAATDPALTSSMHEQLLTSIVWGIIIKMQNSIMYHSIEIRVFKQ